MWQFIASLIMAIVILRWPLVGYSLMLFLLPFEEMTAFWPAVTGLKIIGGITFYGWLLNTFLQRRRVQRDQALVFMAAFLAWSLLSLAWSADRGLALARAITLGQLLLLYLLGINLVQSRKELQLLLGTFLLGAIIAAFIGIHRGVETGFAIRSSVSPDQNPNLYARLLAFGLIAAIYLFGDWRRIRLLLPGIFTVGILSWGIFLSGSRTVWISLPGALMGSGFLVANHRAKIALAVAFFLLAVSVTTLAPHLPPVLQHRVTSLTDLDQLANFGGRTGIWQVGWEMVKDHPFLGVGLGNFPRRFNEYVRLIPAMEKRVGFNRDPHSTFLQVQAELGLIGFLLFLALLSSVLKQVVGINRKKDLLFSLALLIFLILTALFSSELFRKFFWIMLAVTGILYQLNFGKSFGAKQPGELKQGYYERKGSRLFH
ncbi:O-antigen ligase family protein [Calderihabitans maritimus]|uniref:Glycosyltransferase n=1 Tax=Calderihabitans maritimus TaxID=1246530 RepID=A0A1Z5HVI6_9FIRM|nr:O-antigen ligase family protein [Calderihabitans maritimus]GAW93300.1 glycosyltransferase [Calderihabitans maritimus]